MKHIFSCINSNLNDKPLHLKSKLSLLGDMYLIKLYLNTLKSKMNPNTAKKNYFYTIKIISESKILKKIQLTAFSFLKL